MVATRGGARLDHAQPLALRPSSDARARAELTKLGRRERKRRRGCETATGEQNGVATGLDCTLTDLRPIRSSLKSSRKVKKKKGAK